MESTSNEACIVFKDLFLTVADKHAPVATRRVRGFSVPWLTPSIKELMTERDYHHKKAIKTNQELHWSKYKRLSNTVRNRKPATGKLREYTGSKKWTRKYLVSFRAHISFPFIKSPIYLIPEWWGLIKDYAVSSIPRKWAVIGVHFDVPLFRGEVVNSTVRLPLYHSHVSFNRGHPFLRILQGWNLLLIASLSLRVYSYQSAYG